MWTRGLHDGTYNGAKGTFRCTATTGSCTVTFDDKGKVTSVSDGWVFVPEDGATSHQSDYDFLSYGFWLQKTTEDGETTYNEVAPFTMAHGMTASTGDVTGSAPTTAARSVSTSTTSIARAVAWSSLAPLATSRRDASLKAYFGQPDAPDNNIPPNLVDTITGTINKFVLAGGEDQDWSVALKGMVANDFTIEMGTANGGGVEGMLTGQFYGEADEEPAP